MQLTMGWKLGMAWMMAVISMTAAAQAQQDEAASAEAPGLKAELLDDFERTTGRLLSLAEAIPPEKLSWRPSEEVRTAAQVFMHVAAVNFTLPPGFGAQPPEGMTADPTALDRELEALTDKQKVVETLRRSIDYARRAIEALPEAEYGATGSFFGRDLSRRRIVMILLTHAHEHLGQSIAYARSVGVTPPWSR